MDTDPCPRCGKPIAPITATDWGARVCPHCGYETMAGRLVSFGGFTTILIVVLLFMCGR